MESSIFLFGSVCNVELVESIVKMREGGFVRVIDCKGARGYAVYCGDQSQSGRQLRHAFLR